MNRTSRLLSGLPFHCTDGQLTTSPRGENTMQPDHQREHDVDHHALIEEDDPPKRRPLHAGNPRQRQQNRQQAGSRERARSEPGSARSICVGLRSSLRRRTVYDRERSELFALFSHGKVKRVALNRHRELWCGAEAVFTYGHTRSAMRRKAS
jgi:hypothetical protein